MDLKRKGFYMYRRLIIVLLAAISILPATVQGQGRGGGRSGVGRMGSGAPAGRSVFRNNPGGAVVRTAPPIAVARPAVPIVRSPFIGGRHFHRPVIIGQPFGFGFQSPFFSPFFPPFYPPTPIYGAPYYGSSVYPPVVDTAPASEPAPVNQNELDLSYQVGRLTQEVEQLRQEQQAVRQPAQPLAPPTPTVLVFRDGHRLNIVNYMIVGETLWVADEQSATKIPLSDLDLDATRKENRGRGVRFLR